MNYLRTGCIMLYSMGMISCATVTIEKVKDPNFNDVIKRIFVVIDVGDVTIFSQTGEVALVEYLDNALQSAFHEKMVQIETSFVSGLELSNTPITEQIKSFAAPLVMVVELKQGTVISGGWSSGQRLASGTLNITIGRPAEDNLLWRANLKLDGGADLNGRPVGIGNQTVDEAIESLIAALQEDSLFR